jgi:hypothetical protein
MNYLRYIIFLLLFIPCVSQAQEYPVYTLEVTLDVVDSAIHEKPAGKLVSTRVR